MQLETILTYHFENLITDQFLVRGSSFSSSSSSSCKNNNNQNGKPEKQKVIIWLELSIIIPLFIVVVGDSGDNQSFLLRKPHFNIMTKNAFFDKILRKQANKYNSNALLNFSCKKTKKKKISFTSLFVKI